MNPIPQIANDSHIGADQRLELDAGNVAAKEIDGEILVMNVANGMYYSLDGVGAVAWKLLAGGYSLRQTASVLAATYEVDVATTLDDVTGLAIELVDGALVSVSGADPSDTEAVVPEVEATTPYALPELKSYSDMADLLALDPPMPGLADTQYIAREEA